MLVMRPGVLAAIGNTPLVELTSVAPTDGARVLVKLESLNPTGSAKDRSAISMIERAEEEGRLRHGDRVVEMSGGGTGTALAMIASVKGYDCTIVTSDAFPEQKRQAIAAFGARLDIIHGEHGRSTYPGLFEKMIRRVEELAGERATFYTNQMRNPDNPRGYQELGREILAQTDGQLDAFVMGCGSGGCFTGVTTLLKDQLARGPLAVAVEPARYRHLTGAHGGVHKIQGFGDGPPGPLFRRDLVDRIVAVEDDEAYDMARRLAREEGVFGGKSTGANVVAAIQVARALGPGKTVTTVVCDNGYKYLADDLFGG
ncbi:cysteine synthase A [Tamaricihabitans halophyticus]|uniref:Cysteine synthase A n=1 Tax=Tamaricihabitans halophyticus TaxID=1262583 RepID=A0A4R2QFB3_9PSEU|nr:PLP-dependent cysteine synthase family protein [Tamaricihabitans halophyticus]TCP47822.1 cysteine synthase A [Tamaricihabitans halophyticus]